ncbi:E3 ubiquitin-protein ligase LRSAM1 [Toxocara canis]|uniref:E3 ubiquitin-protein ligase LRSAM1 n=1 Tax=Toxocara canis TaxID=6265 RepID=A0A0B2VVX4_TOXCA|nr:E3 ubiquitin-protein ligase LRSAM1 [Toxocara canis]
MDKAIKADGCAKTLESKLYLIRTSESEIADLSGCELRKIPDDFYNFCRVFRKEILDLNCNKLSSLSATDNDEDLLKMDGILKEVNASRNLLRVFPKGLLAIHSLIALDLSENQLTDLPSEICTLSNLEQLNLKANRLQKLPGTIGKLKKLQKLDVSSNLIRRLPLEMSQLDNLRELHVDIEKIEFPCAGYMIAYWLLLAIICDASTDVCGGDTESLKRYLMNLSPCSSHSTNSAAVSSEWDENATLVDRSDISTCAFGSNDVVRYPEANTIDEGAIAFDSEKANRERGMRLEQLRKEQEELDLLVGRVFAQRLQDRQDIADAVNQMEGHAQSIIDNALQVLVSSSNTISDDIAQKVAEVDVLLLSKSDEERKKFQKICAEIVADQNILADFVVSIRERADERSRVLHSQIELIEKALVDISIIEMQRRNERTAINAVGVYNGHLLQRDDSELSDESAISDVPLCCVSLRT